jgi:FAD dependent oxidoreductase
MRAKELITDVLVAGGGVGGCAAAIAIAQSGLRVIMTEETDWIGGQLSAQATPPDEHGWIETMGCTSSYRRFRDGVREYYRKHYPLSSRARGATYLNPGSGWVSPICHEPRVALAVLEAMVAPYVSSGLLTILREHSAVSADTDGDVVRAITYLDQRSGEMRTIAARYILDATELGDLLPLAGVEFVTGSEAQSETGEPSAPAEARPENAQAFSVCFAMDYLEGEDHTIERPASYDFWRAYVPELEPSWPGPLLSWTGLSPRSLSPVKYNFHPHGESEKAFSGLWNYRRIIARENFSDSLFASDISLVNWPMIDYLLGELTSGSEEEKRSHIQHAKQQSLSMFYWLQTEAPRPDGGLGWRGLRLRGDIVGSADGLAKSPYIRESRRIRAEFNVCEQHLAESARPGEVLAQQFNDSVGVGYYRIDLHPTVGGDNYLDVGSLPFQIPLGSLLPVRVENLLPAAKNIGTTHITNGCYRLHPVEWNVGEAAGALAAFCLETGLSPREVYRNERRLAQFQQRLIERGIELAWPRDIRLEEGDPHAHAK